jgi:hypothetical protein
MGRPVVVVTHAVPEEWIAAHPVAPFTFVTDGLPSAIERPRSIVRSGRQRDGRGRGPASTWGSACSMRSRSTSRRRSSEAACPISSRSRAPIVLDGPTTGHPWRPRSPTSGTASAVPEAALVFASLLR